MVSPLKILPESPFSRAFRLRYPVVVPPMKDVSGPRYLSLAFN